MLKVSFVGAGNLAYTIVAAHARAAHANSSSGLASLDLIRPAAALESAYRALQEVFLKRSSTALNLHSTYAHAGPALTTNPVIVLAVKPLVAEEAIKDCSKMFPGGEIPSGPSGHCLISVMAGVTIERIKKFLKAESKTGSIAIPTVIRSMPNTPMAIGLGVTGVYFEEGTPAVHQEWCKALFQPTGELVCVPNETDLNTVTALSGSGPAFFYRLMEKLIKDRVNSGATPINARTAVATHLKSFCEALKTANQETRLSLAELNVSQNLTQQAKEPLAEEQADFKLFIENMIRAGEEFALSLDIASLLVLQTGIGAAGMVLANSDTPIEQLRANVTSKGGTTFAGLEVLKEENLTGTITAAVQAARARAVDLSQ